MAALFARTTRRTAAAALIAVLAFVALIQLGGPPPRDASAAGCEPARPHASGTSMETMTSSTGMRSYRLHVPPSYTGVDRVPLVLNFHGLGSSALEQEAYSEFSQRADEPDGGFIVVYPQGLYEPLMSNHFNAWQLGPPFQDEVAFVDELLDVLLGGLCVDSNQVFSTGMSNGGMMSVRLACSLSDRIAAVAPVAGSYFPPMALNVNPSEVCPDTRAVPLLTFHGTADATVPFDGGPSSVGLGTVDFRLPIDNTTPDDDVMQVWAAHNGCAPLRQETPVSAEVRLVTYKGCAGAATAQLYIVDGGGHTWPGAVDIPGLGYTTQDIDATDLIWQFFQAHPLVSSADDLDGDTVPNSIDDDDDGDGCTDSAELQKAVGSEMTGGRRNPLNPWDFYDVDGNRIVDLFNDVLVVADAFGLTPADAGYSTVLDRAEAIPGDDPWDMHPPNGLIDLFADIFGAANQFGHDCS